MVLFGVFKLNIVKQCQNKKYTFFHINVSKSRKFGNQQKSLVSIGFKIVLAAIQAIILFYYHQHQGLKEQKIF